MSAFAGPELEAAYLRAYDAVMAHWPVPFETTDLAGRYGTTRVTSAGPVAARSLVLLHGYGGTSGMWYPIVGQWAEQHRVRAVDVMGEPGRSRHDGAPLNSMDDLVDWLAEIFDHLELSAADLCGQSLGGHLALRFALAHPERVRRLVLLDPPLAFAGLRPEFEEFGRNRDPHPTFDNARAMFAPGPAGSGPEHVEAYLDLLAHGAAHFPASPIVTPHLPDPLPHLSVPTLVALAGASEIHDSDTAAQAARRAGARGDPARRGAQPAGRRRPGTRHRPRPPPARGSTDLMWQQRNPEEMTFTERGRRAQILRGAIDTIVELGFAQASLARIAHRIGVSKGAVLHYFPDKDSLVGALVLDVYRRGAEAIGAAVDAEPTATGGLRAYIEANIAFITDHPRDTAALVELSASYRSPDGRRLAEVMAATNPIPAELAALDLTALLTRGRHSGEFRELDPEAIAMITRGAIDAASERLARDPGFDPRPYGTELAHTIDRATRNPDGTSGNAGSTPPGR